MDMTEETPTSDAPVPEPDSAVAAPSPCEPAAADSASFCRCASCGHAREVNSAAGTLLCHRHGMHINAEADEIPDDCPEFQPPQSETPPAGTVD